MHVDLNGVVGALGLEIEESVRFDLEVVVGFLGRLSELWP